MILGVVAFSFATGALSSLLQNLDSSQAKFREQLELLDSIKSEYNIGPAFYEELRQSLQFETERDLSDVIKFVNELPHRLKIELSVKIHREIIKNIPFFSNKDREFVVFVGPMLKPARVKEDQYIYKDGDPIKDIFFMTKGFAAYVLPQAKDAMYVSIEKGDSFGEIEIYRYSATGRKTTVMGLVD